MRIENNVFLDDDVIQAIKLDEILSDVFVYIADLSKAKKNIHQYWSYLSYEEKNEAEKFLSTSLKELYISSHGILRCILAYYIDYSPWKFKFCYNAYGKPYLKDKNIYFNMSHSSEKAGYIVAINSEVGIDIEYHRSDINIWELSDLVLTPWEKALFCNLQQNRCVEFFYDIWTKKEAIVKAYGSGLHYPLTSLELSYNDRLDEVIIIDKSSQSLKNYRYFSLKFEQCWSGAVAIEKIGF